MTNWPAVSIIITSYFPDSKRYLDLCIESIRNLDYEGDIETIIVGRPDYLPEYEHVQTIAPALDKFFPPVGLNFGMKAASHELMLVLNDDTILTSGSLTALVETYTENPHVGLLMPASNDQQGRYTAWVGGLMPRAYRFEELEPIKGELMKVETSYPPLLSYHETLCIYAFMISKANYAKVGDFDEGLMNSDDIDYTLRMVRSGLANAICYNAIIYHFGGVSADQTFTPEIRAEGARRFQVKWS